MNELIPISYDNEENPTISGRELHEALEVETPYRLWFPRMCEYGFSEIEDYTPYNFVHPQNKQELTDHLLSIPMAKEICMLQRSEKGKMFRQYFIEVEKQWNSPEAVMSRALAIANRKIEEIKSAKILLEEKIEADKPKVVFAESVETSKTSILVGELAKILCQNGVEIGANRLFEWLRAKGYLISRKGTDYNMPTQKSMELKLFEIKETTANTPLGSKICKTPKVTGKGQTYFINKFMNMKEVNR